MIKNSKILVTGATGLVGSHLAANLCLQGHEIRAIHRKNSDLSAVKQVFSYYSNSSEKLFEQIEWIEADITDIPALSLAFQGITQVYHCAAMVSFLKKDYNAMRKVNIEGAANMVNLALANGIEKFCYVSSIASLDKNENSPIITEENEWNPENNNYGYAISKYGAEMEVWRASQEGLNVVIVNPGVILGSGFWHHNTGMFFTNAAKNFKYYSSGETGFIGVWDVVKIMIKLMESNIKNQRFILVAENRSYETVLKSIAQAMGTKPPTVKVTKLMSEIAWRWAKIVSLITGKPPLITQHTAKTSLEKYTYSSEKIKAGLQYEFQDLKEVIQKCADDFTALTR